MSDKMEKHLDGFDQERRAAVLKLVRGAAFAVPILATFALDGRMTVQAVPCNMTSSGVSLCPN